MPFGLPDAPSTFISWIKPSGHSLGDSSTCILMSSLSMPREMNSTWHICDKCSRPLKREQVVRLLEEVLIPSDKLVFLGFVVSRRGIEVDPSKVDAIASYPMPKMLCMLRSFHGLAVIYQELLFYCCADDQVHEGRSIWIDWQSTAELWRIEKEDYSSTLLLALPNFDLVFEVDCDASSVSICAVLSQECCLITFFSVKLIDTKLKYLTYDKEFYAVVYALDHWSPYLLHKEFNLYFDHEALKHLNSQYKLRWCWHDIWSKFLWPFHFLVKHKLDT